LRKSNGKCKSKGNSKGESKGNDKGKGKGNSKGKSKMRGLFAALRMTRRKGSGQEW
jgi:hypothetical protein